MLTVLHFLSSFYLARQESLLVTLLARGYPPQIAKSLNLFLPLRFFLLTYLWERPSWKATRKLSIQTLHEVIHYMQHFLVAREHRKEKRRKAKGADDEPEPVVEGDEVDEGSQERGHLISYCSLDYQRLFDMARFRMFKIRQTLKSELEDR